MIILTVYYNIVIIILVAWEYFKALPIRAGLMQLSFKLDLTSRNEIESDKKKKNQKKFF